MKTKKTIAIMLITVMLVTGISVSADSEIGAKALDMINNQLEIVRLQTENVQSFIAILKDLIPLMLEKFKDVKETDWYKENLALLFGMGIVQGDDKDNFNPNKEVTGSEYLKMVVVAKDGKTYTSELGEPWDVPYISRAIQLGLIDLSEISVAKLRSPLNRYSMAEIIMKACDETYGDYSIYRNILKDYGRMPAEFKEFVLKACSKGIITGYPDGTFGGGKTMKRSEATAVIARFIDTNQRVTPQLSKIGNDLVYVPLTSEAMIEIEGPQGKYNPHNVDFSVLFLMHKPPMEPQYADAENLLATRFGKDNPKIKEIMEYIKWGEKQILYVRSIENFDDWLKEMDRIKNSTKNWTIYNQTVRVDFSPGFMCMNLLVWREK